MSHVRANTYFMVSGRRHVRPGDIFEDNDPIVKGRESLFDPVEQATAAPGEKRVLSYECEDCDFTTHSRRGLASHRGQKHAEDGDS